VCLWFWCGVWCPSLLRAAAAPQYVTEFILNAPQPTLSAGELRANVAELLRALGATGNFSVTGISITR
jgi:hypothetical protein